MALQRVVVALGLSATRGSLSPSARNVLKVQPRLAGSASAARERSGRHRLQTTATGGDCSSPETFAPSQSSSIGAAAAPEDTLQSLPADELAASTPFPPLSESGLVSLLGMRFEDMEHWLESIGEKPSKAKALFADLYKESRWCSSAAALSDDIGASLREKLARTACFEGELALDAVRTARDGTRKLSFRLLNGGGVAESVLIPSEGRMTLCVSSQLGCAMNCQFCFTAKMGLRRHLTAAQIVAQVVQARRLLGAEETVHNVVFMGMGEPLHNLQPVLAAVDVLCDTRGLGIGRTKVSVSTSGLVPQMRTFLRESPACLAVSLNATTDAVRSYIMPINRKYPLAALLGALREEFPRTQAGRRQERVFFEYVMLEGINDTDGDLERLIEIAHSLPCKINLIVFNPHDGASEFRPSPIDRVVRFRDELVAAGVLAYIRRSRGDDEMAACGQLGKPEDEAGWRAPPPRMRPPPHLRPAQAESVAGVSASAT